eukprot:621393-Amphidinium_carterae.1
MTEYLLEQAEMRMGRSMGLAKWGNEFGLCKMDGSDRKVLLLRHRWTVQRPRHRQELYIVRRGHGNLQDRFQLSRICSCHRLCQGDEDSDAHTPQTKKRTKALAARSSGTKRHAPVMDPAQAVAPKASKSGNASHPAHPSS